MFVVAGEQSDGSKPIAQFSATVADVCWAGDGFGFFGYRYLEMSFD